MRKKLCFGILTALLALQPAGAQEHKWGQLSGSLESNSIGYIKDTEIADTDNGFASNNYLKVDYMYRGLSAGVQLEGYFPGLRGYDLRMYGDGKRFIVGSKYVNWQNDMFHVRLGNIYEQFGSGMAFRTYEDRALGFNNSVEGAFGAVNFKNYFTVKGLWGRQRLYTSYADSARVGGADLSVSLSDLFGMPAVLLNVEGSYVNHHERSRNLPEYQAEPANTHLYSARANFDWNGISLRAEYVDKSKDRSQIALRKGHAWLAELGYSYGSFSALATYRELKHMETGLSRNAQGVGNTLNYLPALTRQYTYSLANLNPYQVQAEGERGGQIDLYYSLRNKSNRHQYWNFHANMSTYYSDKDVTGESRMLWRDVNGDVERQWNKQLKTTLLVSVQEWSPSHGLPEGSRVGRTYASNIFVLDALYKFNRKSSLRGEVQYLYSEDYEKDWVAGLLEFSFAPHWSVSVSDMYNHGTSKKHYYNGSVSYSLKNSRIQVSYGRNRAGYICSGGVCRYQPAYTGANITLTSSF